MTRLRTVRRHPRRRRNRVSLFGLAMVLTGAAMLFVAFACVGSIGNRTAVHGTSSASVQGAATLEQYLTPVVAQDPKPFASLAHADREWMFKTAIWFAAQQNRYAYTSDNRETIPADRVLSVYRTFFGKDAKPQFHTFTVDGVAYVYRADTQVYDVPVTGQKNVYTPHVTRVMRQDTLTVVTVGYIPSAGWTQRPDGTVVPPAPVKTMRYTLQGDGPAYTILAVQHA
ncbi:MAG: hypothetical protein ABF904_01505 [Ethanoligenens sp.]